MKKKAMVIFAFIICIVLGCGIMYFLKYDFSAYLHEKAKNDSEVLQSLKQTMTDNKNLELKIKDLESEIKEKQGSVDSMNAELDEVNLLACYTDVTGPGLIVTLRDSTKKVSRNVNPNVLLIHDQDLLAIINELNAAGAKAISINEQRLGANSYVRCVGPVVNVNGVKVASPFVIKAIGDSNVLEAALNLPNGVLSSLEPWGIAADIEKNENILVKKEKN